MKIFCPGVLRTEYDSSLCEIGKGAASIHLTVRASYHDVDDAAWEPFARLAPFCLEFIAIAIPRSSLRWLAWKGLWWKARWIGAGAGEPTEGCIRSTHEGPARRDG